MTSNKPSNQHPVLQSIYPILVMNATCVNDEAADGCMSALGGIAVAISTLSRYKGRNLHRLASIFLALFATLAQHCRLLDHSYMEKHISCFVNVARQSEVEKL